VASYGQLVGPPSYDDSTVFDRNKAGGEPGNSGGSEGPPPLKITITDPMKKVCPHALLFVKARSRMRPLGMWPGVGPLLHTLRN
jgi:hypothetical protein